MIKLDVSRQIGFYQQVYGFCDRYNLPKRGDGIKDVITFALSSLTIRNLCSMDNDKLIHVLVEFNSDYLVQGDYTLDQIKDIEDMLGCVIYST